MAARDKTRSFRTWDSNLSFITTGRRWAPNLVAAGAMVVALTFAFVSPVNAARSAGAHADSLLKAGKYAEAEKAIRALLADQDKARPIDSVKVATVLDFLVESLYRGGKANDPEARRFAERALAIREKAQGPDHADMAESLTGLANLLYTKGDYAGARSYSERSLAVREKNLGPDHALVGRSMYNLAILLMQLGDYAAARPMAERSLAIMEKHLGKEDPSIALILNSVAASHTYAGDYVGACPWLLRAVAIQEKALGLEHPLLALSLTNLGINYESMGDLATSETYVRRALAIQEKVLGPEHPEVAKGLKNLATTRMARGDFASARTMLERAVAIQEKALGPDHPDLAYTVSTLAGLRVDMGDYEPARLLYQRCIGILEKGLSPEHPEVGMNMIRLANVFLNQGQTEPARLELEKALALLEKALGPEHNEIATGLTTLSELLVSTGDLSGARAKLERALAIREKSLGPNHADLALILDDLGPLLAITGHVAEAQPVIERSLTLRTQALGPDHPRVAVSLNLRGRLRAVQGDIAGALDDALRAESIGRDHLQLTSRMLTEREALRYAAVRSSGLDLALTLAARGGLDAESRRRVLDALVRSRAVVLDEMAMRHHVTRENQDPKVAELATRVAAARERLANLVVRGTGDEKPEVFRGLLESARDEKEQAERALAEASAQFAQEQSRRRLGADEVAASLPPRGALIAFAEYKNLDLEPIPLAAAGDSAGPTADARPVAGPRNAGMVDDVPSYLAFVLRAGDRNPAVFPLGPAAAIDDTVARWKTEAAGGALRAGASARMAEAVYRRVGAALRGRVWDPFAAALAGVERVFIVPDGSLNLVQFAALPDGEDGYLVEHDPLVHYVSAERDLVPAAEVRHASGLLALGGPDYEATSPFASLQPRPVADSAVVAAHPAPTTQLASAVAAVSTETGTVFRGARASCGEFESLRFAPLPETGRETEDIVSLWQRHGRGAGKIRPPVVDLRGGDASEANFKRQAPDHRVLHLATHGFFLGGDCGAPTGPARGLGGLSETPSPQSDARPAAAIENPLLQSGLVLAGANRRAEAGPNDEDGILTAEEIASLDLEGAEWAVLSACETGVGDVRSGEGVFGLRRAFKVAGAGTVIMSLWSVDDEATRAWMRALYEGRLKHHLDTAQAARRATLSVLQRRRDGKLSAHPFYWGAFVAAGDWR